MKKETRYYTKPCSDGAWRLYVEEAQVTIIKTRQGKKSDMKKAIAINDSITKGIHNSLLERYVEEK